MQITFQDLVSNNFTSSSVRRLITYANTAILNTCNAIIKNEDITGPLTDACSWFATSLAVTYHADKIREMFSEMKEDIKQVLSDCANDKNFADTAAYAIGTNSEVAENYSVVERMILLCAAAQFLGWKFDFTWNS